jgi:hypothetical protein
MAKDASFYASNSVLSTGTWYKIKISTNGIYKLTYEDLVKMGITNPANVQVRGYGGWMLEEDFSKTYYDDLPQVAIWMNKGSDGIFNAGDYILFYGKGSTKWTRSSQEFIHANNPYSDYGYYFVSQGDSAPLTMGTTESLAETDADIDTYTDYMLHEKDEVNLLESGREFYGESFYSITSRSFSFSTPGITSWVGYNLNFVAKPSSTITLSMSLNGTSVYTRSIDDNSNSYSAGTPVSQFISGGSIISESNVFNISLNTSSVTNAYLNYLRINFKRKLQPYGDVTFFRNDVKTQRNKYLISNATANMIVFEVTEGMTPTVQQTSFANGVASFGASASTQKEYALVNLSGTIPTPEIVGKIANQNLHALEKADMVIIVPPIYKSYAEKLAAAHLENSGLTSLIVDPNEIYNEFSSGTPDATAYRRFLKMFYDRGTSMSDRPRYLLLFGGGTFNNKFINSSLSAVEKSGYLLSYQSANSLSETSSYVTDDYFGFLQKDSSLNVSSAKLCLGIGRLPARSTTDAETYINKIIAYMNDNNPGIWKNNICFLADDAVAGKGYSPSIEISHETQSDKYAQYVQAKYPNFIVNKIYMDSYKRVVQSNGNRYPDAQADLIRKLNAGQLVLNYVGHGSTRDWAHEYVMTFSDIQALTNKHLPLWVTATCDYSRFDGSKTSGGEAALLNTKGGAIALLSTVRVVYISNNDSMSTQIYRNIFERENGKALRLGDIIKNAKLSFTDNDENKVRFLLLGDPALRLSYPDDNYNVKVTQINDVDVTDGTINIPALSNVKISGQIVDKENNLVSDFGGKVSTVVFDAQQDMQTRDNGDDGNVFNYKNYLNTLFSGTVDVENGTFNCDFVAPKDIMYTSNKGKMSFFAWEDGGRSAQGSFLNYTVQGTDISAISETNGPEITAMYLNTPDFVSGGQVNTTPMLRVDLKDESGINLSGGIGHVIELVLDGKTYYDITSYFVSTGTSTKEGYINYSLPKLSEGNHNLKITVWDVWNNYTEKSIDFSVSEDYKPRIMRFSVANNPVKEKARFLFTSNLPQSTISVRYDVYAMNGALIWTHQETGSSESMDNYIYDWDLLTNSGASIKPGIYICKATISVDGNVETSKSVKLMVLGQ